MYGQNWQLTSTSAVLLRPTRLAPTRTAHQTKLPIHRACVCATRQPKSKRPRRARHVPPGPCRAAPTVPCPTAPTTASNSKHKAHHPRVTSSHT